MGHPGMMQLRFEHGVLHKPTILNSKKLIELEGYYGGLGLILQCHDQIIDEAGFAQPGGCQYYYF